METNELQQQLFSFVKDTLPPHLSLVDELQDLLALSADSVYRRIRGEKPISLPELKKICEHFHLSLDELLRLENDSVLFQAPGLNGQVSSFRGYLEQMVGHFRYFYSFPERKMYYLCKDVPFWYFFLFPEMAAFKSYFWMKTIHNDPTLSQARFSLSDFDSSQYFLLGQQIIGLYNEIPSEELWNVESINSTINQIAYYRDAGLFATKKDENAVIDSFQETVNHLEHQASKGQKMMPGGSEITYRSSLQFYVNELILGNNTILLNLNGQRLSLITYSVLSYLMTRDTRFADKAFEGFNSLLSRSSLISNTGEKERHRFFNELRRKIDGLRN